MMVLVAIAALIVLVFFGIQVYCLVMINVSPRYSSLNNDDLPVVSLLLAARNEEKLIIRSLESIAALDYPPEKLEVLIGDDDSTDRTAELVREFIKGREHFSLTTITSNMGKARRKANVLAQLAHQAKGEYFFITDVDVKLPGGWIRGLLGAFEPETGLVSGTTMCERGHLFATMQSMDWLHFMGYIKAFANGGVACTSVGNNMAVRASAYFETGGYETMEFSITEDYRLFQHVTHAGWGWKNILTPDTLGLAWYISDPAEMLHQRKRWLIGANELPFNWKFMLSLYGLFIPALVVILLTFPVHGLAVWGLKAATQTLFISRLTVLAGVRQFRVFQFLIYEIYLIFNTVASAIFYFLPIPSVWKGRAYHSRNPA